MERIVLEVDDAMGKAYQNFSPRAKSEVNRAVSMFLKKAINDADAENYQKFMDDMGHEAEANGLTPQKLAELLRSDDPENTNEISEWWEDKKLLEKVRATAADMESGKDKGIPWNEVKKQLLQRGKK